ncbi:hypothetical protein CFU_2088 [Collimonas fungivorans Ter331]|uniref:Uncharacterized protein n=1 Tax=Collimonas fungivorans (strain Ter331) TaxID=1005048 RepID=G0ABW2_COLFT|nr:hypothetical protein CFU_2088 [Collimonas fungivorans Ter331]
MHGRAISLARGSRRDGGDQRGNADEYRHRHPAVSARLQDSRADGRRKTAQGKTDLGADRHAGQAHPGIEHFTVQGWPDAVRRTIHNTGQQQAEHEDERDIGLADAPQVRPDQACRAQRAEDEHRFAADAVRQGGERRDRGQGDDIRQDQHGQHGSAGDVHGVDCIGQREHAEDGAHHRDLGRKDDTRQAFLVFAQQHRQRQPGLLVRFFLFEGGRLGQGAAHPDAHQHHDRAQEKRNAPAPGQQLFFRQRRDRQEHQGRQDQAGLGTAQGEAGEKGAPMRRRMLQRHRIGAGLLACRRHPLQHAQHHQHDRRADADLSIGRQQADQESGDSHQQQGEREHFLAPVPVADMAQQHRPYRPCHITDAESGERRHGAGYGIDRGEKYLAEHQRRGGAVDEKIVIFDSAADPAGERGLARRTGSCVQCSFLCCGGGRRLDLLRCCRYRHDVLGDL